jgi:hypothetical protein
MHVDSAPSPRIGGIERISDPEIERLTGASKFLIVEVEVFGTKRLALDVARETYLPARIGLVRQGDFLVIALGCRDSHGSIVERACASVSKIHGGPVGYEDTFGGGLIIIAQDAGEVTMAGTSGDLGGIRDAKISQYAATKVAEFIRLRDAKG